MTLLICLTAGSAIGILGYLASQSLMALGARYEEDYLKRAEGLLDAIHAPVGAQVIWRASLALAALGLIVGLVAGGWLVPVLLATGGAVLPLGFLKWAEARRQGRFQEQLPDLIAQTRTAVACGYTLPAALGMAQRQLPAPASQELKILAGHLRLGVPLSEALARLQRRMPGEDLDLFVGAITLAERAGGQIGQVLVNIETTIRDRLRLVRKLRTMTSRGRMEAWIIALAPVGLGAGMYFIHPTLMQGFFAHPHGIPLCVAAAIWMVIGHFVIRRILTPDF